MQRRRGRSGGVLAFAACVVLAASSRAEDKPDGAPLVAPRGTVRIDFDDRLMQGQTNRLGAVYLYQRKDPAQPSLLDRRKSFRHEIRRDVLE